MQGALIAVLLKPPWRFDADESPDPRVLIGTLSKLDPSKESFNVVGFTEMHIGIGACDAIYRMADGFDLLKWFDETNEDGEDPAAAWRTAEFVDHGHDTVAVLGPQIAGKPPHVIVGRMALWEPLRDVMVLSCRKKREESYLISKCSVIQRFVDDVQVDLSAAARASVMAEKWQEARRRHRAAREPQPLGEVREETIEERRARAVRVVANRHALERASERLRLLTLDGQRVEEASRAHEETRKRREFEQANTPERREAQERLAALLAEYRVRERETAVESSLRRVIGGSHESIVDHTTCVALTDAERSSIRHAAIAKLVHAPRGMCWSRAVYPGLDMGEFIFGTAPDGRQQYIVRYPAADDGKPEPLLAELAEPDDDSARSALWRFLPHRYVLHPVPVSDRQSMWSFDGSVPPPGYPVTTAYEKRIQHCTTVGTPGKIHASAMKRRASTEGADRDSLRRQKHNARHAQYLARGPS